MDPGDAIKRSDTLLGILHEWGHCFIDLSYKSIAKHYTSIPSHWTEYLSGLDEQLISDMMSHQVSPPADAPDDFSEWLHAIKNTMLNRTPEPVRRANIPNEMTRKMSIKKQHEISILLSVVPPLASSLECTQITDVGAGLCKLSVALATAWENEVLAIDMDYTEGGAERAAKYLAEKNNFKIIACTVDDTKSQIFCESGNSLVVGLHSCGPLGSSMVDAFIQQQKIRGLLLVSCCWHYLCQEEEQWVPMSQFFRDQNLRLARHALILANHAAEKDNKSAVHMMNTNRTMLHKLLVCAGVDKAILGQVATGRVRGIGPRNDFTGYVRHVGPKLKGPVRLELIEDDSVSFLEIEAGVNVRVSTSYLSQFTIEFFEDTYQKTMIMWSLRDAFAPVLESIFLLDRVLCLMEIPDVTVEVFALFDPKISPRNLVIKARKLQKT